MIRFFAGHPTAANLFMVAVLALGLLALPELQRDTFPRTPATEVQVSIKYPGATSSDVENAVCGPVEEAVEAVADLIEVRCDARENRASVTVEMREGADINQFFTDVSSAVEGITTFPARVEQPAVTKVEREDIIAEVAITGEMSDHDLRDYAEAARERIRRDPRISQVAVLGFSDREVLIEIPQEVARRYRLSLTGLAAAIQRQSVDLPAGSMESHDSDWVVRFADERRLPQDFADILVKSDGRGGDVRLGDIARITLAFADPEDRILVDGRRAAVLQVSKTEAQDTLRVRAALEEALDKERARAPRTVVFTVTRDLAVTIQDRLRLLAENGLQGLALVFVTMWLFFSLRFSFWVSMGLPVSFLGTVFFMYATGLSINMMTMMALIVAIGLLMDDAIVISENVAARHQAGDPPLMAAVNGTAQVLPGVISSLATTIVILGPIAFLAGKIGAVLKFIPIILVVTLLISLVEAFLILPAHLRHSLHGTAAQARHPIQRWFDRQFEGLRSNAFRTLAQRAIEWRYLTVGIIILLTMAAYATLPSGLLKFRAFPELESDVIQARILLPQGTPLERTETVVARVTEALGQLDAEFTPRQGEGRRLVRNVTQLYNVNVDAYESGPHVATVSADLLRAEERTGTIDEMLNRWRELTGRVPDVLALKFTDRERGVAGRAIDIRLSGDNLERLKVASHELQAWLASFRGVQDLSDDLRPGKPELRLALGDAASLSGVQARQVAEEVRAALLGQSGLVVRSGFEEREVTIRLAAEDRRTLRDIEDIAVSAGDGQLVPLSAVASIEEARGYARIHRVDGQRTVTVQGTVDTGVANAREIMAATQKLFVPELQARFPDVAVSFVGEGKEAATTGSSLSRNLIVGVLGVFILLALQFRSYVEPIVVFVALPMGFTGAVAGHLLLGYELSMPSLVGMATLAGVVVNDSILLVGFMKSKLGEGLALEAAALEAACDRFRAVVLTSLTTIAGLLPLLLETSTQAQFLIPLVISLAFGLLVATLAALFTVPALYAVLVDIGWIAQHPATADKEPLEKV